MLVGIRGVNTRNKGAELMLVAIAQELAADYDLVVDPFVGSYRERASLGLLQQVAHFRIPPSVIAWVGRLVPRRLRRHLREQYGLVFEGDLDAVLDASGFAYSDQFDGDRSRLAATTFERLRKRGSLVVLLPQAFGPFELPDRRKSFLRIAESADQVFARERASLSFAIGAGAPQDRIAMRPDFTCCVEGTVPESFDVQPRTACVVPSAKILTETPPTIRAAYLPFLASVIVRLRAAGFRVIALQHERGDSDVIAELSEMLEVPLLAHSYEDPRALKGVLGASELVIGSRFHALVSSLSQGVPCLAVGWSHKYKMLFDDYDVGKFVVAPDLDDPATSTALEVVLDNSSRHALAERIAVRAGAQKQATREMWDETRDVLHRGRS